MSNDLGNYLTAPAHRNMVKPGLEIIARKFYSDFVDLAVLEKWKPILAQIAECQRLQDFHSPTVQQRLVSEASEAHALNPCKKTLEALRHLKTLTDWDHSLVQTFQVARREQLILEIAGEIIELYRRAAKLVQKAADSLESMEVQSYASFSESHSPSALLIGLRSVATDLDNVGKCTNPRFTALPDLVEIVVKIAAEKAEASTEK